MATRLRFTISDDICLLREVLAVNPYEDSSRWSDIHNKIREGTGKDFCLRTVKDHVQHLVQLWKKEDKANLRKSGTEEQYGEKEQLLQQITDMARDFTGKSSKGDPIINARQKGVEERDLALLNFQVTTSISSSPTEISEVSSDISLPLQETSENSVEVTTQRSRKRKGGQLSSDIMKFMEQKQKDEVAWREQQQQLEREKFELEKQERLHRIEMERKQQAMMEKIINLLGNK
ncbi:uncharacterized protein [Periplaneta americana]|uniref:uncharacterized protein n=1 Tax=Periplaneta americana TaxID=6978 RepID=UPI0037E96429